MDKDYNFAVDHIQEEGGWGEAPRRCLTWWREQVWLAAVGDGTVRLLLPQERAQLLVFKRSVRTVLLAMIQAAVEDEKVSAPYPAYNPMEKCVLSLRSIRIDIDLLLHEPKLFTLGSYRLVLDGEVANEDLSQPR